MTPEEFRVCRRALGLTQVALARRLGAGRRTVQQWESGERKIPEIAIKLLATLTPPPTNKKESK